MSVDSHAALLSPRPELPDDTPLERVRLSTRIKNALSAAGMKTVGAVWLEIDRSGTRIVLLPDGAE